MQQPGPFNGQADEVGSNDERKDNTGNGYERSPATVSCQSR
jgi:hypothetical protein